MRAALIGFFVLVCAKAEAGDLRVARRVGVAPPVGQPIVRELLPLADHGLVIVGDGFVAPAGPGRVITKIFVMRLDANGAVTWSLAWGQPEAGPYGAVASGAVLGANGEIVVAGQTFYDEPAKGFVLRVSSSGQVVATIDIPAPNTNVDDVVLVGGRAHVAARELVSFNLTSPQSKRTTPLAASETSNGDLVAFANGNLYFGATTETSPSRDFTLVRVREGGAAQQVTIGGSADDQFWALAVAGDETRAYAVGRTLGLGENGASSDFPYRNPLRPFGGGADATLVAFQGTSVVTATSWGGNALDSAYDVAIGPARQVVVVGETESTDFPSVAPLAPEGSSGRAYGSWFDADLSSVLHSTRLGDQMVQAQSVVFDSDGRAVIAGRATDGLGVMWIAEVPDPFVTHGGNDWWVEVAVGDVGFSIQGVDAQISGGAWQPLTHQSWGTWAASFYVPPSSAVRFRAVGAGGVEVLSHSYLWPYGEPIPDGGAAFAVSFIEPRGNAYWVETDVGANKPIARVEARIETGAWFALPRTDWGSYAVSHYVPAGQHVQFRATSDAGEPVSSLSIAWPP